VTADLQTTPRPSEGPSPAPLPGTCPRLRLEAGAFRLPDDLPAAALFVVEGGVVAALSGSRSGRRMVVAVAVPGDVLAPPGGEQQLLALQDAVLCVVTAQALRGLLGRPRAAEALLVGLLRALREREESLAQFATVAHAERVRRKLLQLAHVRGRPVDGGMQVELPLTHALLAQMVGSARETVSGAVRALEQEGFLTREGGWYRLRMNAPRR
jgi:CRP-like cAMP-binding protein